MTRLPAAIPVLAGVLALFLIAPFAAGFAQMGVADWAGVDGPALGRALWVSVASATLATALVVGGGVPLGYVLARRTGRGFALLGFVVQLPLALPPLSSGVLLLFLLGYASPLGRLTGGALTDSFAGIVLAEAFVAAPFLIIAARSAFASIDPALEDVAASLGHTPGAVFRKVSLPLAWRSIIAGTLLAWLRAFGEFGATVMVAYHPYSLPVYTYVAFGSQGLPAMLPVLVPTLMAAIGVMAASHFVLRPTRLRNAPVADMLPPLSAPLTTAITADEAKLDLCLRRIFDGFTLDVAWTSDAKRIAILGASGSGKSLTLRAIAGLGQAAGFEVRLGNRDLGRLPPEARAVAYLPQTYGLMPHLAVGDQIRFAADCDPALARHWTERLALAGLERRRPAELSLGQQQRVALARALSRRAMRLLLLDEPFSALDTPLRHRLRAEMLALQREMSATSILVTHDPAEAMLLADDLVLLDRGRVLQAGPVNAVFSRPINEAAARLLGAVLTGAGIVTDTGAIAIGDDLRLSAGGLRFPTGQRVGWAVRPQQIRIGRDGLYPAVLLQRGPVHDGQRQVTLQLGNAMLAFATDPGCPAEGPCRIDIDPEALQVWPCDPIA